MANFLPANCFELFFVIGVSFPHLLVEDHYFIPVQCLALKAFVEVSVRRKIINLYLNQLGD